MQQLPRRGVTRSYVLGVISLGCIFAVSLVLAGWGLWALQFESEPIATPSVPLTVAPVLVLVCLGFLAWCCWRAALALLRGSRVVPVRLITLSALGSVIIWGLGGTAFGLSVRDAWASPYPWLMAAGWGLSLLCVWWVLFRQIYTDRGQPRWPWELDDALDRIREDNAWHQNSEHNNPDEDLGRPFSGDSPADDSPRDDSPPDDSPPRHH